MSGSSARAHPSLAKLRDNLVNGTIDFAEVPIADMNPEDIRVRICIDRPRLSSRTHPVPADSLAFRPNSSESTRNCACTSSRIFIRTIRISASAKAARSPATRRNSSDDCPFHPRLRRPRAAISIGSSPGARVGHLGGGAGGGECTSLYPQGVRFWSPRIGSQSAQRVFRVEEDEKSSMIADQVTPAPFAIAEEEHVSINDLTVESSPHNIYLARSAQCTSQKLHIEPDQSVRV
jgi:hypothetical protein